jgi:HSP20 family molecular chaperone IbpA
VPRGATLAAEMKRISRQWGEAGFQVTRIQYVSVPSQTQWKPEMNVYRCHDRLIVSLDAAGVDLDSLETTANIVRIRGHREAPEPHCEHKVLQILALEIDHGRFEREVHLPFHVTKDGLEIEYRDGFLCVDFAIPNG